MISYESQEIKKYRGIAEFSQRIDSNTHYLRKAWLELFILQELFY
jgi:hypothetical protein